MDGTAAQVASGLARRFRIVRRLGAGGMGTVFLAEQIGVGNRPVALKVLNRKLLDDPEFLLRFQNEAGSTGRIRHANVVTIYESSQAEDGTPYIAMEFLEGETLHDCLKRRGALPVAECAEILRQTANGLNAAHKLGIIHRDLKPDNIFLTQGDEGERVVKVVDFGIAKLRESSTHTLTGMVLGTPAYMSSEQASGMRSDRLDLRSDLYSLGVVVYEMLTGRVPFHSDTPLGYLRKHMMEDPPPFRAVAPGLPVPPQLEAVVIKALAKDRDQRYASALEFAREFSSAAAAASDELSPTRLIVPDETQAEQERQAREKAEAERRSRERAEAERLAREKAEQERWARERAEAERRAREKTEADRPAREKAEQERLAREKAETERRAREKAEQERQARETEAQVPASLARRFRIVQRLGEGGMGTVFLAEQIDMGDRRVELKVMRRNRVGDPDLVSRFQNEASPSLRLRHPNLMTIYESAQTDDGTPYIAMEYLEGESLRDCLNRRLAGGRVRGNSPASRQWPECRA